MSAKSRSAPCLVLRHGVEAQLVGLREALLQRLLHLRRRWSEKETETQRRRTNHLRPLAPARMLALGLGLVRHARDVKLRSRCCICFRLREACVADLHGTSGTDKTPLVLNKQRCPVAGSRSRRRRTRPASRAINDDEYPQCMRATCWAWYSVVGAVGSACKTLTNGL